MIAYDKYDEQELKELCVEWQRTLRLQDWDIQVRIARAANFYKESKNKELFEGEVTWMSSKRNAIIQILDPVDYPDLAVMKQDMERTLIHELLHIHFISITPGNEDSREYDDMEVIIHRLSQSLIEMKRGFLNG